MIKNIKEIKIHFIKYLFVGGINLITSMLLFFLLFNVLKINYLVVFTITWLYGIFLTYIINFIWVFKPEDKLKFRKRFNKYFIVYLSSYIINLLLLKCIVEGYDFNPLYVQFFILPLVVIINFSGIKYWALK